MAFYEVWAIILPTFEGLGLGVLWFRALGFWGLGFLGLGLFVLRLWCGFRVLGCGGSTALPDAAQFTVW